jgi:ribosomal protein L11 methyltransferase
MRSVVVSAPADEAELAAEVLWSLGVVAIEERHLQGSVVELWTSLGEGDEGLEALGIAVDARWPWRTVEVDERVADTWREHATAVHIDDELVVVPAWRDDLGGPTDVGRVVLAIEPGSTFGLGDHPTTRACLLALRREITRRPGACVLDVGCGSGILSIAAVRFGAANAVALDIAPAAVPITNDNARRNGVEGAISVSTAPLEAVDGRYDVVVANILAPTLVELADELMARVAADGVLIISGILAERHDHVLHALHDLEVTHVDVIEGWATVSLEPAQPPA